MEAITRDVRDLEADKRRSLEAVVGHQLHDDQQIIIQVVSKDGQKPQAAQPPATEEIEPLLPEWCNVYAGLTDDEIADLESTILQRADLSRSFD